MFTLNNILDWNIDISIKSNFYLLITQNIQKYMKYENVFTEDYFDTKYVSYKSMKIIVHKSKEIYLCITASYWKYFSKSLITQVI